MMGTMVKNKKRITVVIEDDVDEKIRKHQARLIKDSANSPNPKSISYSETLCMFVRKGLKKS